LDYISSNAGIGGCDVLHFSPRIMWTYYFLHLWMLLVLIMTKWITTIGSAFMQLPGTFATRINSC